MKGKRGGGPRIGAGRPKGSVNNKTLYQHQMDLAVLCRRYTHVALNALVDVALNGNANERTAASRELVQRGYGMPRQPVDVGGQDGGGPIVIKVVREVLKLPGNGDE